MGPANYLRLKTADLQDCWQKDDERAALISKSEVTSLIRIRALSLIGAKIQPDILSRN